MKDNTRRFRHAEPPYLDGTAHIENDDAPMTGFARLITNILLCGVVIAAAVMISFLIA